MFRIKTLFLVSTLALSPLISTYATPTEIKITGSSKFEIQVKSALSLLSRRAPEEYAVVTKYISIIEEGQHSAMWAYKTPPRYELADQTAFSSITWCASTIAHDAFHSKLYHDWQENHSGRVPSSVWTGLQAEKECIQFQLVVLKKISAPSYEINYASKLDGSHFDVNKDGQADWEDYKNRNW